MMAQNLSIFMKPTYLFPTKQHKYSSEFSTFMLLAYEKVISFSCCYGLLISKCINAYQQSSVQKCVRYGEMLNMFYKSVLTLI